MQISSTTKPIIIVQGGQWGSEAKGLITAKLANDRKVDFAIRTGTVNAGHTVYYKGRKYAMQQLPVAWVNPDCKLVLGPGAYIYPEILAREIDWINEAMGEKYGDVRNRIFIDAQCGLHTADHTERSTASGRHHSMGATGKGSSQAVVDKINGRGNGGKLFTDTLGINHGFLLTDTSALLNRMWDAGQQLLIEGTQGTLLDLHLGDYPFTTHKQTQAANWMAEAGLSCTLPTELVLVMRTYPIRVAGNSGPLPREISWSQFARWVNQKAPGTVSEVALAAWDSQVNFRTGTMGDPAFWSPRDRQEHQTLASEVHRDAFHALPPEHQSALAQFFEFTTVTKKLRRIAQWDDAIARRSVTLNRPHSLAITFMNYLYPQAWGVEAGTYPDLPVLLRRDIAAYARRVESMLGVKVSMFGFGPYEVNTLDRATVLGLDEIGADRCE